MPIDVRFAGDGTSDTLNGTESTTNQVHSTKKEKAIPRPLENKKKTMEDLFAWANYHYGYDEKVVRTIMKSSLITEFHPDSWMTYTLLLRDHKQMELDRLAFPPDCPVCHAPIEPNRKDDGMFGQKFGWRCTEGKPHFVEACWSHLKPLMVSRTDKQQFGYEESDITRYGD